MTQELREEARRREEERETLARKQEQFGRDLIALAGRQEGRRLFRWLLEQGELFAEDYQAGYPGAYRAGRRSAALRLWNLLARHLSRESFLAIAVPPDGEGRENDS